ncbi:MAG: glycosyltransferase, partial [Planctomycetaceae bacterium]
VCSSDLGEIASAIDQLVENEVLRKAMGEAGRRSAVDNFSWSNIAERTVAVYRKYTRSAA